MIFVSDLDRTLIYSKRFINEDMSKDNIRVVEKKGDKVISHMTNKAIRLLKDISQNQIFVPVTTRTIEQYKRIALFDEEIPLKYAVVSNGGNILIDGELDEQWKSMIVEKLESCANLEDVITKFNDIISDNWVYKVRVADDLFVYSIIDQENILDEKLDMFCQWLDQNGWRHSLQGRKLYFIPKCVSKGEAIDYIAKKEEKESILAAGDSLLDLDMCAYASLFLSPRHGEIYKQYGQIIEKNPAFESINFIEGQGIAAAEEILEQIISSF